MRVFSILAMPVGIAVATLSASQIRQQVSPRADQIIETNTNGIVAPFVNYLILSRQGDVLYNKTQGPVALGSTQPLRYDSLMWYASATKILAMMSLLKCVDLHLIGLNQSVLPYLPDLAAERVLVNASDPTGPTRPRKGDITTRDLITLTAGNRYPIVDFLASLTPEEELLGPPFFPNNKTVYSGPHANDPGVLWQYGAEVDYVGLLVEALQPKSLDTFVHDNILTPCGVLKQDFTFFPTDAQRARYAGSNVRVNTTFIFPRATPVYNDTNVQFASGGDGGIGTIGALANAVLPLVNNGKHRKSSHSLDGPIIEAFGFVGGSMTTVPLFFDFLKVLSPAIVKWMFQPQLTAAEAEGLDLPSAAFTSASGLLFPGVAKQWGGGALLFPEGFAQTGRGNNTLQWAGIANCYWTADVQKGVVSLAFTQILPQSDEQFTDIIQYPVEKLVYDAMGAQTF